MLVSRKKYTYKFLLLRKIFVAIYFTTLCSYFVCAQDKNTFPLDSIGIDENDGLSIKPYYKGKIHGWRYDFELAYDAGETEYLLYRKCFYINGQCNTFYSYRNKRLSYKITNITYFLHKNI